MEGNDSQSEDFEVGEEFAPVDRPKNAACGFIPSTKASPIPHFNSGLLSIRPFSSNCNDSIESRKHIPGSVRSLFSSPRTQPRQRSLSPNDVFNRAYREAGERSEELSLLMLEGLEKQMQNCSFSPSISGSRGSRRFGDFLKEQQEHVMKREAEMIRLRTVNARRARSQLKHRPTISPNSSRILAENKVVVKEKKEEIHERLYANKPPKGRELTKPDDNPNFTFKPKIHPAPPSSSSFISKRPPIKEPCAAPPPIKKIPCRPFDKSVEVRVEKTISRALNRYKVASLNQGELAEVLEELQLCETACKDSEGKLAKELWMLLGGASKTEVPKQAISTLLLALMTPPRRSNSFDGTNNPQPFIAASCPVASIGTYTKNEKGESVYSLSAQERQYVHQKFSTRLRCNRLSRSRSKSREGKTPEKGVFSPQINEKSKLLADTARAKVVDKRGLKDASISELLNLHQALYKERKELMQEESERKKLQDCTFKPKTNAPRKKSPARARLLEPLVISCHKKKPFEELKPSEPTFHPVINKKVGSLLNQPVFVNGKEKNIERLRNGRTERERVALMLERGESPSRKTTSSTLATAGGKIPDPIGRLQQKVDKFLRLRKTPSTTSGQSTANLLMSSRRSPESYEEEGSSMCIELTLEQGKSERIRLDQYESLGEIVQYLGQKYGLKAAAQEKLAQCIMDKLKECAESKATSPSSCL